MRKTTTLMVSAIAGVMVLGIGSAWGGEEKASRPSKASLVSFRLAADTALAGYKQMTYAGTRTVYVSPAIRFNGGDVASAQTVATDVELTLNKKAAARLTAEQVGSRLAVFVNKQLVAAPIIKAVASGKATLSGLAPSEATGLARMIRGEPMVPIGPSISLEARQALAAGGGEVIVDVYLSGVSDLIGYQLDIEAIGGTAGDLALEDIAIEQDRIDFVFGSEQMVNSTNLQNGMVLAALVGDAVPAEHKSYLATYKFRVSSDAAGAFTIRLRNSGGSKLRNASHDPVDFRSGAEAQITIGAAQRPVKKRGA